MAVGACEHCDHFYLLEGEAPRFCPSCRRPLRLMTAREALGRCRDDAPAPSAPDRNAGDYFYETRLLAESLARWAAEAVATSQCLRDELNARRDQAREQAQALARQRQARRQP